MQQPANDSRYILSEVEVMGKGGLVAQPVAPPPASKGKIILSGGNWELQRASEVTASGEEISTLGYKPENWIVATVPGTVLSSYKNIGAIADPNYADNQLQVSESFFWSNFWYRDEFEVPEGFKQDRLFLNFDGINWKANVFLNGKKLGRIEGAFMRGKFDVTDLVVPGKNVVAVEIIRNNHIGAIKEKNKQSTDFNGGILGADNPDLPRDDRLGLDSDGSRPQYRYLERCLPDLNRKGDGCRSACYVCPAVARYDFRYVDSRGDREEPRCQYGKRYVGRQGRRYHIPATCFPGGGRREDSRFRCQGLPATEDGKPALVVA